MHGVIIAAVAAAFIHLSGAIETVAPVIGGIGSILTTVDSTIADVTGIRNYLNKRKLQKTLPIKQVKIPTKAPKNVSH